MKRLLVILSFVFAALVHGQPSEDDVRKARVQQESDARAIDALLSQTSEVELISIDPTPLTKDTKPDDRVSGRAILREKKAIAELRAALVAGIRENQGTMIGCWDPRHGLKFKADGREVTLTICFHCEHGYVAGVAHLTEFYTSRSPQAVFDRVFKQAGLTIAK
jgi:hypothetical protein